MREVPSPLIDAVCCLLFAEQPPVGKLLEWNGQDERIPSSDNEGLATAFLALNRSFIMLLDPRLLRFHWTITQVSAGEGKERGIQNRAQILPTKLLPAAPETRA